MIRQLKEIYSYPIEILVNYFEVLSVNDLTTGYLDFQSK